MLKLSAFARAEWLTLLAIGVMLAIAFSLLHWWWGLLLVVILTLALLLFFRDPDRIIPTQRNVVVSPADGRVSSVHTVEHYEPLGQAALCVRVFLSVLDVHVNRSPCHGIVASTTHKPGEKLNALNPRSAEVNESHLTVMLHPIRKHPIAAVRQVAGLFARTIYCDARQGQILQRGQRMGIIKLGSTTEVYLPMSLGPKATVERGQRVIGGVTVVATLSPTDGKD